MNVLQLTDSGVKAAMMHEALVGKKRIGRGSYSAVYDNGETVLKLTADMAHYEMLKFYADGTSALPVMTTDYFHVGTQKQYGNITLYLFEVEKLVKMKHGTAEKRLAQKMCKAAANIMGTKTPVFERHKDKIGIERIVPETFYQMSEDMTLPLEIREALEQLGRFSMDYEGVGMDFHMANFMIRPSTGQLVMSDPVMSINIINKAYQALAAHN